MSESVTRIRKPGYDSDDNPIDGPEASFTLTARAVAPGSSTSVESRGRDGEKIDYTVFFVPAVDLTDDDDLIVRGDRCKIRVLDWRSGYGTGRRGMQVLASIGRG